MAKLNNLKTVVRFEIVRNLKKPTFWLAAILLPVLLIGYIALMGTVGSGAEDMFTQGPDTSELHLGVLDESGVIDRDIVDIPPIDTREQGIEQTRQGELNVFYFIPADFAESGTIEIFTNTASTSLFANYEAPIREALAASAATRIDPADILAVTSAFTTETTNYNTAGEEQNTFAAMVIPIVALALFYVLIVMFGNRLTMATIEEKENRITEMILTSVSTTTLIVGKIVSLIALGLIQLLVLIVPLVIAYFATGQDLLPADFSIDWNIWTILSSLALLILGYFLFAGASVAVGALVPTAKELAPYASIFMILVILPMMSITSFLAPEPDTITYILSHFPLTAPVALLLRNAFGTLPPWELVIGLVNLTVFSAISIYLAVFIFKRSAMDFTTKLSLQALIRRK